MFVILLNYIKPLEVIDQLKDIHMEFINVQYQQNLFICSGRKEPRTGGVILAKGDHETAIWDIIKQDPFYIHQAAEYQVIRFLPTMYDTKFACFLEQ